MKDIVQEREKLIGKVFSKYKPFESQKGEQSFVTRKVLLRRPCFDFLKVKLQQQPRHTNHLQ
jgi:hypothetical protein